ncbi:MAG TPA: hypothetical protein DCR60_10830 [Psychrobacter sp.]|nr:hypothetical protein [Psychrobacter sp.]|tara:strand:- start:700 stop:1197 length:498 start_codon:yes stop_codon:yes gene_type:complete
MADICLLDTSILLNILDIPSKSQNKNTVMKDFRLYIDAECRFIIPLVVAVEVGNHISQNGDGGTRRKIARQFVDMMQKTFNGESPFEISDFDLKNEWQNWIGEFIDRAGQNKTAAKPNEGMSLTDLSIIKEYNVLQAKNRANRNKHVKVFIWSLDSDLEFYGRSY